MISVSLQVWITYCVEFGSISQTSNSMPRPPSSFAETGSPEQSLFEKTGINPWKETQIKI